MQPVRPRKGRGRDYEEAERLLARSIAVPKPRFAGIKLPGFGGSTRAAPRHPAGATSHRGGRAWRSLAVLFLAGAVGYGLWLGGKSGPAYGEATTGLAKFAVALGFGVKQITIEGQQHLSDGELTAALGAGPGTNILAFNTDDAKARLEAVPWIKRAQVMRLLPSTLQVVVEERIPFAVWQSQGQNYVIDSAGAVLAPVVREAYADLPLVVGEGANKNAADLLITLAPFASVRSRLIAAFRVGDRRWTLKLMPGVDVMLPDDNVETALNALIDLDQDKGLLAKDISAVDLRLADRVAVRLRDGGEVPPDAAPAGADVPTASVKSKT